MSDIRDYINPQPHGKFTAAWQLAMLPEADRAAEYTEDKSGKIIDALIRSVRKGAIVRVRRLFCLAPWTGTPRKRRTELAKRVDRVKERGGAILEAETQRCTDVRGNTAQMLMGAYDDIATGGRAMPKGKMGRPGADFTPEQMDAMRQIWFSRLYKTRDDATAAIQSIGIKISRTKLYGIFGTPDREAANVTEVISLIPAAPKQVPKRVAFVYFIKDGDKVKIGHSIAPIVRMTNLTTHTKLVLLGVMNGGRKREQMLHKKFAAHLIPGTREWFKLVPEITKYIAVHKRHNKD